MTCILNRVTTAVVVYNVFILGYIGTLSFTAENSLAGDVYMSDDEDAVLSHHPTVTTPTPVVTPNNTPSLPSQKPADIKME